MAGQTLGSTETDDTTTAKGDVDVSADDVFCAAAAAVSVFASDGVV